MPTALVVGSANADLVYSVSEFPEPGETITAQNFKIYAGGKGANQAVACANSGANVEFCACIGQDNFGEFLSETLSTHQVGMIHTTRVPEPTGSAVIFVNRHGQNQIVLNPGANHKLTAEHVYLALTQTNPSLILLQLEIDNHAIAATFTKKQSLILNPAPFKNLEFLNLNGLYAMTPNETECAALTGITPDNDESTKKAANHLLNQGIQNVIITLGKRGCYWTNGQSDQFVNPPQVTPIDTTGAGDVFNGALVARLLAKESFPTALKFAVTAASISTTRHGALQSAPSHLEVLDLLYSHS